MNEFQTGETRLISPIIIRHCSPCAWLSQNPSAASLGVSAEAKLCMGSSFCRQLLRDSLMGELNLDFGLKLMRFPYFCKSGRDGAFQLWLQCLFLWLLRCPVFWLSPSSTCTAAPLRHSLQMLCISGCLITSPTA